MEIEEGILKKIQIFWNDKPIATGIPLIDLQHIWLIYIIFKLESFLDSSDHENIKDTLNEAYLDVLDYAAEHFGLEEDLMNHFSFPELDSHIQGHRNFTEKLKDKYEDFTEDEIVAHGLLGILKKWLTNHILIDDMAYSKHLQEKGEEIKDYCAKKIQEKEVTITKIQVLLYNKIAKSPEPEIKEVQSSGGASHIRNIWKSYKLAVNIPIMDIQHIWLLKLITDLDSAVKDENTNKKTEVLKKVIDGAIKYTEEHFAAEEKLMKQFRFTDLINHSNQHKRFVQFVKKRADEMQEGDPLAAEHLASDLKNWLLSHIAFEDRKIGEHLKDKVREVSEFTKKVHQSGEVNIKPEHKALYKEVMKN